MIQQSPNANSIKSGLKRAIKVKLIPQAKVNSSSIQKEKKNSNFGNIPLSPKITGLSKSISKQQICIKVNTDLELIPNRARKSSKIQLRHQSTTEQIETNSPKNFIITRNASIHKSNKHGISPTAASDNLSIIDQRSSGKSYIFDIGTKCMQELNRAAQF